MAPTVEVHDRIESLVVEWERLAQLIDVSPFLLPGYISAWWRTFGKGELQVLAAYQNDRLAGVLPMRRFRGSLSSPTNSETPLFGLLAANEMAAKQLSEALFSGKVRRVDLSFLDPTSCDALLTAATAESAGYRVIADSIQGAPYVAIDGTSWEAYESGLRSKFRSELRRRRRRLEEEGQLALEVSDGRERLNELLEEGFCLEDSGWKGAQGTSVNARPAVRRFYTEVAHWAAECGWLQLAFLRLNGRAIAFEYNLEYNKILYLLKGGYDPSYRKFAPIMIMTYMMLHQAFAKDLTSFEFLGAFEEWKQEWTTAQRGLGFLHMFAPTAPGYLDQAAYLSVRATSAHARSLTQSSVVPERVRRLLKQGYSKWHRVLDRKGTEG